MLPRATQADHELKAALLEIDVDALATRLNAQINVPLIPETAEQIWIVWILRKALTVVPAEVVVFLIDSSDGLTPAEVQHYEDLVTQLVNDVVDVPVINEDMESNLIRPVVRQLMQYALSGVSIKI